MKRRSTNRKFNSISLKRVEILYVLLFLWSVFIIGRIAMLTIASDERVDSFIARQGSIVEDINLSRGVIYDRNHNELAVSVGMDSIYINPRLADISFESSSKIAYGLEPDSDFKKISLAKKIYAELQKRKDKSFVWIKRKVGKNQSDRLKSFNIEGLGFLRESRRFYPNKDLASRVIGFCGIDNQGLSGIEYKFDNIIRPVISSYKAQKDALGRFLKSPQEREDINRSRPPSLILSIDERIQFIAERALEKEIKSNKAKGGVAIVMQPKTGEILAIGEYPSFNSNSFMNYDPKLWNSMAVADVIEPGSTMKVFTIAAALEEKLVSSKDLFFCENGKYKVGDHIFSEAEGKKYAYLNVSKILAKSSNIGAIKIAENIGKNKLYKYLTKFGFGSKTGIDLPGESSGLLRLPKDWSSTSLASISFGQEIGVTPIQLASAISAIANGGDLMQPMIVKSLILSDNTIEEFATTKIRKVLSSETVDKVKKMLRSVVLSGTGRQADVDMLDVAGKTGTAQKIDPVSKAYSKDRYVASFIGFAPVDDPALSIVVIIDEPRNVVWGGSAAAPVFAEIVKRSFSILNIKTKKTNIYELQAGNSNMEFARYEAK